MSTLRMMSSTARSAIKAASTSASRRIAPSCLPARSQGGVAAVAVQPPSPQWQSSWHRGISTTFPSLQSATGNDDKPEGGVGENGDECPEWQNPLHHNNPDYVRVLSEEFAPGEEMPMAALPPFDLDGGEGGVGAVAPPHIHELAEEIVRLNMLEVKMLMDRIGDHFGFSEEGMFDDDDVGGAGGGGGAGGAGGEAEEAVEQTAFDLKLTGFDAKSKIKVIKEIRGITSLGLKEAKELVEGAPTVIKKGIKKEEAEELKAKLEEVGAQIEIA